MNGKRPWLGWIAVGLSGLALLVALFGAGFARQGMAGMSGANARQSYAQQGGGQAGAGPQGSVTGPGANAQPGAQQQGNRWQGSVAGPGANAQPGAQQQGSGPQGGSVGGPDANAHRGQAGPGANAQRGPGQPGGRGFGFGSWFHFIPFKLIGGAFQTAMLALLIVLGLWFFRGRNAGSTQAAPAPAQAPLSPTGESYSEEAHDPE